jgi:hypothetical protein
MLTASVLVVLGVLCRLVPHPPNAVAIGAIALFAGARLPRRWAWVVPIASMVVADLFLDWGADRSWLSGSRWVIYLAYLPISLLGRLAKNSSNPIRLAGLSLGASIFFFFLTNFGVWAFDGIYPTTYAGLVACFLAAVPYFGTGDYGFFANGIVADLAGTGVLFGFDALVRAYSADRSARPIAAAAELVSER